MEFLVWDFESLKKVRKREAFFEVTEFVNLNHRARSSPYTSTEEFIAAAKGKQGPPGLQHLH